MNKEIVQKDQIKHDHVAIKAPQFSFHRLLGSDPILDVEMSSTGEVACFGDNVEEAFLKSLKASNVPIPEKGSSVLVCLNDTSEISLIERINKLGYHINAGNETTKELLEKNNISCNLTESNNCDNIKNKNIDLVLDMTKNSKENYTIRRTAIDYNTSLITNDKQIELLVQALEKNPEIKPKSHCQYFEEY